TGEIDAVQQHGAAKGLRQPWISRSFQAMKVSFIRGEGLAQVTRRKTALVIGYKLEARELSVSKPANRPASKHFIQLLSQHAPDLIGARAWLTSGNQSERRDASRCGEGIGIEGSRVLHLRFPWSGLQAGQDIGATGHAAARQAARQDLGEGGQIRSNTIV